MSTHIRSPENNGLGGFTAGWPTGAGDCRGWLRRRFARRAHTRTWELALGGANDGAAALRPRELAVAWRLFGRMSPSAQRRPGRVNGSRGVAGIASTRGEAVIRGARRRPRGPPCAALKARRRDRRLGEEQARRVRTQRGETARGLPLMPTANTPRSLSSYTRAWVDPATGSQALNAGAGTAAAIVARTTAGRAAGGPHPVQCRCGPGAFPRDIAVPPGGCHAECNAVSLGWAQPGFAWRDTRGECDEASTACR